MLSQSKKNTVLQLFNQGNDYWQIRNKTSLYFLKPIYNIHELVTIAILIKTNVTPGLINESLAPAITKIKNPKDKNKKFRFIIPVD